MVLRRISRTLPQPSEVSRSSTSSLKLRVAMESADMVGPFRTVSSWVFTKYLDSDGVGAVTCGGEKAAGAGGTADSWTAATLETEGVFSDAGIGGAVGVCSEVAGDDRAISK